MCAGRVDLDNAAHQFDRQPNWYRGIEDDLTKLGAEGMITHEQGRICVTDRGGPALRVIASLFDANLGANARHAVAV